MSSVLSPEQLGERAASLVDGSTAQVSFGQVCVDVPAERWHDAALAVRDDAEVRCGFFDWLSAYDDPDAFPSEGDTEGGGAPAGGLAVVLHVWSTAHHHHLRLRTTVPREAGRLATVTDVWPGAGWHERETFEMFGIVFDGHPNLVPLLLPDGFEGHPLRKEFVLASRVAKPWPGAKEPGESDQDLAAEGGAGRGGAERSSPGRRRMLPPGVPAADEWGPDAARPGAAGPPA
jgi:NADH-quinone oxidoreductase subunit C